MFKPRATYRHHLENPHNVSPGLAITACFFGQFTSNFILSPVFHGHPWLTRSYGGSSVLPSFWTVCRHFILAHLALIAFIKALRDAPDSRNPHLRSRHYITLLPCSRHLFILSTSLPCPLFLPDSRPLPCRRRNL